MLFFHHLVFNLIMTLIDFIFFFLILRPPPISTLFPYTTLFRSPVATPARGADPGRRRLARRIRRGERVGHARAADRKSTRLNSSHMSISYAVFCLKKKIVFVHFNLCASGYDDDRTDGT